MKVIKMKSTCCPVCYKVGGGRFGDENLPGFGKTDMRSNFKLEEGQQRFFKVLKGYLNEGGRGMSGNAIKRRRQPFPFSLEQFVSIRMISCVECYKIMESFCQLHHQLKTIELLLNWHVGKLKSVMMGAQRVPSRMSHFREFVGKLQTEEISRPYQSVEEMLGCIVKSKKLLISKCSEKVANAFPKLEISKCDSLSESISRNVLKTPTRDSKFPNSNAHFQPVTNEVDMILPISSPAFPNARPINPGHEQRSATDEPSSSEPRDAQYNNLQKPMSSETRTLSSEPDGVSGSGNGIIHETVNEFETTSSENTGPSQTIDADAKLALSDEVEPTDTDHIDQCSPGKNNEIPPRQLSSEGEGPTVEVERDNLQTTDSVPMANSEFDVDDCEFDSELPEKEATMDQKQDRKFTKSPSFSEDPNQHQNPDMDHGHATLPANVIPDMCNSKENQDIKFGLRAKHRCSHCMRTFSSSERLQSHVEENHHDQSGNEDEFSTSSGSEGDNPETNWSPSDSSEEEDDFEPTFAETDKDDIKNSGCSLDIKSTPTLDTMKPQRVSLGQETIPDKYRLRLKCPDCDDLHQTFKSFLLHRKDAESCKASYNPTTSVRVEVLAAELNAESDLDQPRFSTFAIINLPQAIFPCDDCGLALYSAGDFEKHQELHGDFPCTFCDFKSTFAPTLSIHELQHSKVSGGKRPTRPLTNCPRCDVRFRKHQVRTDYVRHHLKVHLSLVWKEPSCAICKTTYNDLRPLELAEHLKSHHDLSTNANLETCTAANCGAYYLTQNQLHEHVKVHHLRGDAKGGSQNCKDCNKRFENPKCLRRHRLERHPESSKDGVIKCPHSKFPGIFETKRDLDIHIKKIHSASGTLDDIMKMKCPDCDLLFSDVKGILLHRKNQNDCLAQYDPATSIRVEVLATPENESSSDKLAEKNIFAVVDLPQEIYICDDCGTESFSQQDEQDHKNLHGKFKCHFCNTSLAYAPDIPKHERSHIRKKYGTGSGNCLSRTPDGCPRCDFKFPKGGSATKSYIHHHLKNHMSLTFNETKCGICKTTALNLRGELNISHHLKQFHDLKNATENTDHIKRCSDSNCGAYFLTNMQLRHHLRLRHQIDMKGEKRTRECKDCGKCYFDPNALRHHRLKFHVESDKVIPCVFENCSTVCESNVDLVNHISATSSLLYHKAFDGPTKDVQCPTCEANFSGNDPRFLVEHMQTQHRVEKPTHVCEFCGKVFKDKDRLELHYLSHSGPESWQFQCNVCSKKCISQHKLDEHMRTHTKDKPFVCQVCGLTYAHRHNLRIHVNNKHGDQVQDIPRKVNKINFTSRKGIKRKLAKETDRDSSCDSDTV